VERYHVFKVVLWNIFSPVLNFHMECPLKISVNIRSACNLFQLFFPCTGKSFILTSKCGVYAEPLSLRDLKRGKLCPTIAPHHQETHGRQIMR
jgi:hypothetical protein